MSYLLVDAILNNMRVTKLCSQVPNSCLNLAGITATLLLALTQPVRALEVKISPQAPQQGDTISVIVSTENDNVLPTVTAGEINYPVFKNNGRYRAFIPTSPLGHCPPTSC